MKLKIAIIFGGQSSEHQVSLLSAQSIINAINKDKYQLYLIGICTQGNWYLLPEEGYLHNADDPDRVSLVTSPEWQIALVPNNDSNQIVYLNSGEVGDQLDIAFPIVHGTSGEDGGLQGYFNLLNLAFVGSDVLGSAVAMDKDIAKQILVQQGINVADFITLMKANFERDQLNRAVEMLGFPMFVKPVCSGSSIGVRKAKDKNELVAAVEFAFQYDDKVIVEECIDGREIECAVLGNYSAKSSLPGEIVSTHEFYSYEAKYIDKSGAELFIPAKLSAACQQQLRTLSVNVFHALSCFGLARVDFFVTENEQIIVNEVNTLPGFTSISMYPKLWQESGIDYADLIDQLLALAIQRYANKTKLLENILTARS